MSEVLFENEVIKDFTNTVVKDFIEKNGEEIQTATKDFTTRAIATTYSVKDGFLEFIDNGYDSIENHIRPINFSIIIDNESHTFTFRDDGDGIKDYDNLFKLGGTNKIGKTGKIGKFGIGVSGAVATIATKCVFDKSKPVYARYESCREGKKFTKLVLIEPNGDVTLGKNKFEDCDSSLHYTEVKFSNVLYNEISNIIDEIEETFEETLRKKEGGINISVNGRQLGKSGCRQTFIGDEKPELVMVGDLKTYVKYRIVGGSSHDDRSFDESGLRVYSQSTGRLLGKSKELWSWYAGRQAQPNICGLRAAIYIVDSIKSYNTFGVKSTKNGIGYIGKLCKTEEFKELSEKLSTIYNIASNSSPSSEDVNEVKVGGKTFIFTTSKLKSLFNEVDNKTFVIKSKYSKVELANIFNELISCRKRIKK